MIAIKDIIPFSQQRSLVIRVAREEGIKLVPQKKIIYDSFGIKKNQACYCITTEDAINLLECLKKRYKKHTNKERCRNLKQSIKDFENYIKKEKIK